VVGVCAEERKGDFTTEDTEGTEEEEKKKGIVRGKKEGDLPFG
jgi:hypothetical protein